MSGKEKPISPSRRGSLETRLYLAAAFILVAGLVAAVIIYALAPDPDSAQQFYRMADSPQYLQQLRRIGGTGEVALAEIHQWIDSLWHGKALAYTVAGLCAAIAGACFLAGRYLFFQMPEDRSNDSNA